jgi:poly-gamma-glutamate synthase PgsB/CapB
MPMTRAYADTARRVLVTGSRGKSSIVRLLHAALQDAGLRTYSRITGVVPRELGPQGVRPILRSSGAHVEEMRWWLRQLPATANAIVLENSAITPELQNLAGQWLRPELTILSNTLADHQEVWGPDEASAALVLAGGVPRAGQVLLPKSLEKDTHLLRLLERRSCRIQFAKAAVFNGEHYHAVNLGLAVEAVSYLGLAVAPALETMLGLSPDSYDFQVARVGDAEWALAFSANDLVSTRTLFQSLNWPKEVTRLVYNHRRDRPGRLKSFAQWLDDSDWREVLIIGDKPRLRIGNTSYRKIRSKEKLLRLFRPGDRVFGCGNIAGLPLALATSLVR